MEKSDFCESVDFTNVNWNCKREILKLRYQRIVAELQFLEGGAHVEPIGIKRNSRSSRPIEDQFHDTVVDFEKGLNELGETLSFLLEHNKELSLEIEHEQKNAMEFQSISSMLKRKTAAKEQESGKENCDIKKDMNMKLKNGEAYFKSFQQKLGKFVDKHFPMPSEERFTEVRKKLRSTDRLLIHKDMVSFKRILSELMNKCIDTPDDPYIVIDHTFWPPYVELLLQCHIVHRHQDDANRIRLVPFHM